MRSSTAFVAAVVLACGSVASAGVTYQFLESCTNNNAGDVLIGQNQMSVEISDAGGGFVDFTFRNSGPAASSITDLYWDDGTLLALASIVSGPGTSFSQGAAPPELPGGNNCSPPFQTTQGFSADSNPPAQPMGVNPGEFVTVRYSLQGGQTYADTIAAMADGTLRIGIHVQGYATGGSEGFVASVPTPGALALLGLGGLVAARRRR